jgi:hypothetical protein
MLSGCGYGLGDLFSGVFWVEGDFLPNIINQFSIPPFKFPVGFNRLEL